jgi:hypothetical protein
MYIVKLRLHDTTKTLDTVATIKELEAMLLGFDLQCPAIKELRGGCRIEFSPKAIIMRYIENFDEKLRSLEQEEQGKLSLSRVSEEAKKYISQKFKHQPEHFQDLWLNILQNGFTAKEIKLILETAKTASEIEEELSHAA